MATIGNTEISVILGKIRENLKSYFYYRDEGKNKENDVETTIEKVLNSTLIMGKAQGMFESLRLTSPYLEDEWQWVQGTNKVAILCQGYEVLVVTNKGIKVDLISKIWR